MVKQRTKSEEYNWFRVVNRLGGKCARCGCTENLQVDHKDPREKVFEVKSRLSYKWINLIDEVDKCQLLCKPCHKDKTYNEDWNIIKEKKQEFIHVKNTYLPLFDENNLTISIDTSKKNGRVYAKWVEHRAEKTGNTFEEVMLHDHIVHKLLYYVAVYDKVVKNDSPWSPDTTEKEQVELEQALKEEISDIKNASQGLYDELYDNILLIKRKNEKLYENKRESFAKLIDYGIENDDLYLCDKWMDVTLTYHNDYRKVLKSEGY